MSDFRVGDFVKIAAGPYRGRRGHVSRFSDDAKGYDDSEYPAIWCDDDELELISRDPTEDEDE